MVDIRKNIIYGVIILLLAICGAIFGYMLVFKGEKINISNLSALDFANNYDVYFNPQMAVTASTKTQDITVTYVDYYTVCNEEEKNTKTIYGSTVDSVKEQEKEYQEKNGLIYTIVDENDTSIKYFRKINENCPNHFNVIYENGKLNIYTIKGENKQELYNSIDINIDNIREELKVKITKGTIINSKEELNRFIEDLET